MKKLPSDFTLDKYGLHVRLVTEDDAEFIVSLRTDKKLGRFINETSPDIKDQIKWIQSYKKHEKKGTDYYFIYFKDEQPIGVNRIYNILENYATIGSWICSPSNDTETSLATYFFMLDILFEYLYLDLTIFDVRKKNTHVWKLHKMAGAVNVGESELDYYFVINKQTYYSKREKLLTLLNIN